MPAVPVLANRAAGGRADRWRGMLVPDSERSCEVAAWRNAWTTWRDASLETNIARTAPDAIPDFGAAREP